ISTLVGRPTGNCAALPDVDGHVWAEDLLQQPAPRRNTDAFRPFRSLAPNELRRVARKHDGTVLARLHRALRRYVEGNRGLCGIAGASRREIENLHGSPPTGDAESTLTALGCPDDDPCGDRLFLDARPAPRRKRGR